MTPDPAIVADPVAVTPAWITDVLRRAGHDVTVTDVVATPVGTGQMAHNERFTLTYEGDPGDAPRTVVGKFPSPDPTSRASGATGAYATEVRFYRELAPTVAIRTPRCLWGAHDDTGDFVLILEDLAPAAQGDQIAGCSLAQAEAAVHNLAGLHGPRWNDPALRELDWVVGGTGEGRSAGLAQYMELATAPFVDRYRDRLTPEDADLLQRFAPVAGAWSTGRMAPFAPVHGDYRLDNLLFATAAGGDPVATVDWQTLSIGLPLHDLAFFLGNSLHPEQRRAHERDLVERYHAALGHHGVHDYRLDACWDDYRYGQFHGLVITILGSMAVVQTDRGDDMFMAMAARHCAAIRDLEAEALLPSPPR
jgi:hypothetical protein